MPAIGLRRLRHFMPPAPAAPAPTVSGPALAVVPGPSPQPAPKRLAAASPEQWFGLESLHRAWLAVHFDQGFRWLGHFFVGRQVYRL